MTLQFLGFALPGTIMFLFGVGWCWGHAAPRASHDATLRHAKRIPGSALRLRCWPRLLLRHPVQGVLKLVVSLVGIVGSLFAAYPDGSFQYVGDVPFATVYLFFVLSGIVDVLACYCPQSLGRGHSRAVLALAFVMEALLFYHAEVGGGDHDQGQSRFALQLLVAVMVTSAVATAMCGALPWPHVEAVDALRCTAAMVHGSWLYHCGMLLYWPVTDVMDDTVSTLWVTLSFAWHCAAAASLLIVFLVTRRSSCAAPRYRERSPPPPPPFSPRGHGVPRGIASPHSSHSPHHSCLLCNASVAHRSGSLV